MFPRPVQRTSFTPKFSRSLRSYRARRRLRDESDDPRGPLPTPPVPKSLSSREATRLLEHLTLCVHLRLARKRGRPTVVDWTERRVIPLQWAHWALLKRLAGRVGMAASHLATAIIEDALPRLRMAA